MKLYGKYCRVSTASRPFSPTEWSWMYPEHWTLFECLPTRVSSTRFPFWPSVHSWSITEDHVAQRPQTVIIPDNPRRHCTFDWQKNDCGGITKIKNVYVYNIYKSGQLLRFTVPLRQKRKKKRINKANRHRNTRGDFWKTGYPGNTVN